MGGPAELHLDTPLAGSCARRSPAAGVTSESRVALHRVWGLRSRQWELREPPDALHVRQPSRELRVERGAARAARGGNNCLTNQLSARVLRDSHRTCRTAMAGKRTVRRVNVAVNAHSADRALFHAECALCLSKSVKSAEQQMRSARHSTVTHTAQHTHFAHMQL